MTSKQRAYLKGLAMTMDPILQLGKGGLTPENTAAVEEALAARELIKISVLQNCLEDPREMAQVLAERTRSQVVQVIGKKIVLYREGKKDKKNLMSLFPSIPFLSIVCWIPGILKYSHVCVRSVNRNVNVMGAHGPVLRQWESCQNAKRRSGAIRKQFSFPALRRYRIS